MINYTAFEQKIIEHNLRKKWRDGLFAISDKDKDLREKEKYLEAKKKYALMLGSSKNNKSIGYHKWALNESLGITPYKVRYRKSSEVEKSTLKT